MRVTAMLCDKYLDMIFERVSALEDDFKVIKAYPNSFKPTRLDMTTVAVSIASEDMSVVGLGGYGMQGDITVCISVFSQYKNGIDELNRVADIITNGITDDKAKSVSLGKVECTKSMDTFSVDIMVKYSDFLEISYE